MQTPNRPRTHRILPALVALLGTLAAVMVTAPAADAATAGSRRVAHARDIALNHIGDRYSYGAAGPRRFDCSGLVYYSYHKAGLTGVPRTSSQQARHARHIPRSALRPGDFLYFYDRGGVYHVAIFLRRSSSGIVMLHAPGTGDRVRRDHPWTSRWFAGTLRRS